MSPSRNFLLTVIAVLVFVSGAGAQDEEICAEHGIINTEFDSPIRRFLVVFGRVSVKRPKGETKPPTIVIWLREGRSTQRYSLDGPGSYCFQRSTSGGEVTVDVNGQEAARRSLIANLPQQREDFDFTLTPSQKEVPPGVVSAKFNYKRSEKNVKLFEKALAAKAEQKPDKAIEYLTSIVNSDPADYNAKGTIGSIYYRQKKFAEAEDWFRRAVETNPEFTPAWISLAQSQYALKQFETCIESCKKVAKLDPNSAVAFYILGEAYLQTQKGNLAVEALNQAIKLDPITMAECHLILADLYDINGFKKMAVEEYKAFLSKVPDHPQRQRFEQYIQHNSQ